MNFCRVCGGVLDPDIKRYYAEQLDYFGTTTLPEWANILCSECLIGVDGHREDRESRDDPINETYFVYFLLSYFQLLVRRKADKLPLERCEALKGFGFLHGPDEVQCPEFAKDDHEGHKVCWRHKAYALKGETLRYIDTTEPLPKPWVIWAGSPEQLIERAKQLANDWALRERKAEMEARDEKFSALEGES